MTDKELLEMAAKAAGVFMRKEDWPFSDPFDPECLETTFDQDDLSITGTIVWYGSRGDIGGTELYTWSPLTDDGDALRLAVKLELQAGYSEFSGEGVAHWDRGSRQVREYGPIDPFAATRRAIVRAAAEIGRAMK